MNERTRGNGPFKMKGSPYKVIPLLVMAGKALAGAAVKSAMSHGKRKAAEKQAAGQKGAEAAKGLNVGVESKIVD